MSYLLPLLISQNNESLSFRAMSPRKETHLGSSLDTPLITGFRAFHLVSNNLLKTLSAMILSYYIALNTNQTN